MPEAPRRRLAGQSRALASKAEQKQHAVARVPEGLACRFLQETTKKALHLPKTPKPPNFLGVGRAPS